MGDGLAFADRSEVWVNVRNPDDHRDAFSARVPLHSIRTLGEAWECVGIYWNIYGDTR